MIEKHLRMSYTAVAAAKSRPNSYHEFEKNSDLSHLASCGYIDTSNYQTN